MLLNLTEFGIIFPGPDAKANVPDKLLGPIPCFFIPHPITALSLSAVPFVTARLKP